MQSLHRILWLTTGLLMFPALLLAQRSSSIVGRVTDTSGGVVPDVVVTATNKKTGFVYNSRTTVEGIYTVPALPVGIYRVETKKEGFKTAVGDNIELSVAQQVALDFTLEVGEIAQQVTVTSEAPLLDLTSPEVGSSMNDKFFHELPIPVGDDVRDPQALIFSSLPGTVGNTFTGSINGGQLFSHEIMVDGVSVGRYDLAAGADALYSTPSVEAIGEFKLQTANYSAQYGGAQTGIVSFTTKSGTNELHGKIYEYHRNRVLDAAGWAVNTFAPNGLDVNGKAIRAHNIRNNFGGTLGGPVVLPKLYHGKNKTFFFVSYDGLRTASRPAASPITMPTTDQLQGNFSRLLDLNNRIGTDVLGRPIFQGAIYDPATTRTVSAGQVDPGTGLMANQNGIIRDGFGFDRKTGQPIPGQANIIPQNRWSQVSSKVVPLFSTIKRLNDDLFRNTVSAGIFPIFNRPTDALILKVDHNISDRHKFSTTFNYSKKPVFFGGPFFGGGPLSLDLPLVHGGNRSVRVAEDWSINDHWVNSFKVGYNLALGNPWASPVRDQDWPAKIGLTGVEKTHFPELTFGSGCYSGNDLALSCVGQGNQQQDAIESYIFIDDMSYTRGKHQFKWGGEARRYRFNFQDQSFTSGHFGWSNAQTALPGSLSPFSGFLFETGWPFASFLLGTANGASRNFIPTQPGYRQSYFALYFQDDWRATAKLTLSLGLRWDVPTPKKEAFDRQSSFDPNAPNPGADNRPGALVFLKNIGRGSFQDSYYRQLGPRFGLAYQLTSKMVLRGGYGITYAAPNANGVSTPNLQGFNSSLSISHFTPDPRFSPAPNPWDSVLQWDNGLPPLQGVLPNTDPAAQNFDRTGAFVHWLRRDSLRQPYIQSWSFGLERELPLESVLEVNYVGNKGTRLIASLFSRLGNTPSTRFMALQDANGNALLNKTFADLTSSDRAILSAAGVAGKPYPSFPDSVPISQALRPFPQYAGLFDVFPNFANSTYHALQATWRKRPTRGLTFIAAYAYSKTLSNSDAAIVGFTSGTGLGGYSTIAQWPDNRRLEKSVAEFDTPHALKLTWAYELPLGRGKRFLNQSGPIDKFLGNWKVTGVQGYQSGTPLAISTFIPSAVGIGIRADVRGDVSKVTGSVGGPLDPNNGTLFLNVPSDFDANGCKGPFCRVPTTADGYALRPGSSARYFGNLRTPGRYGEDFGIVKGIRFTERTDLEFVVNFFNAFNRHGFGRPDTAIDLPTFGRIRGAAFSPRSTQFALRLSW